MLCWTAFVLAKLLHQVELFLRYDRLMGILEYKLFFLRISYDFLIFTRLLMRPEINRMPDILLPVEYMPDSFTTPTMQLGIFMTVISTQS